MVLWGIALLVPQPIKELLQKEWGRKESKTHTAQPCPKSKGVQGCKGERERPVIAEGAAPYCACSNMGHQLFRSIDAVNTGSMT